jgi:hypothetical protein
VKDWVTGLLQDQDQGKTEQLAYSPDKTTVQVVNDTDINGLAAAVSDVLSAKGFAGGTVGNNDGGDVPRSQVQAPKSDDLGAEAVAKELGGLPVVAVDSVPQGSVRVVLATDYTGPGSGLQGGDPTSGDTAAPAAVTSSGSDQTAPPPSPIITAGSDDPQCVN